MGCGYWGPKLIRSFYELSGVKVVSLCDVSPARLNAMRLKFPGVGLTTNFRDVLRDSTIDAVVIATPISTHYSLARQALRAGKHVLVEKPLTGSVKEAASLVQLAAKFKKILMVGHTFIYNPAVQKIGELLKERALGDLHYLDSVRVNLGLYQTDGRNVLWDLAPHDIAIILHWIGKPPVAVSAWGRSYLQNGIEDVAFMRLEFANSVFAHFHMSWLAPAKIRRMTVVGNQKMVLYDDLESAEKIRIADQGAHLDQSSSEMRVNYRMGDIVIPCIKAVEPLAQECAHFVECVLQGRAPETDGENGLEVVRILEAADKSLKKKGALIRV
ncbi:MAG: Gfo/Idh/MocA family oxidoreductase [Candidatus Omnitrophica bacterium]|nr:Gfo/Idh/MocA family oxidoreductase [Candidatus Omnitrophota bacterium]